MKSNTRNTRKTQSKTAAQRTQGKIKRDDQTYQKKNAQSYNAFAEALPALLAQFPRLEWEIVHNYLTRNNRVMIDAEQSKAA